MIEKISGYWRATSIVALVILLFFIIFHSDSKPETIVYEKFAPSTALAASLAGKYKTISFEAEHRLYCKKTPEKQTSYFCHINIGAKSINTEPFPLAQVVNDIKNKINECHTDCLSQKFNGYRKINQVLLKTEGGLVNIDIKP